VTGTREIATFPKPAVSIPVLVLALLAIAILAFVLPFGVVRTLHARRLAAAAADVGMIARALAPDKALLQAPAGIEVLIGPGVRPPAADQIWTNAVSYPLGVAAGSIPEIGPDPWGNAYVVNVGAWNSPDTAVWVLSAGPNGRLDTSFRPPARQPDPANDDCGVRLH